MAKVATKAAVDLWICHKRTAVEPQIFVLCDQDRPTHLETFGSTPVFSTPLLSTPFFLGKRCGSPWENKSIARGDCPGSTSRWQRTADRVPYRAWRALRQLASVLAVRYSGNAGDVIRGSGGVRKLRWGLPGHGKRGGLRIINHWITKDEQISFLTVYRKTEAADLSKEAIREMRRLVKSLG